MAIVSNICTPHAQKELLINYRCKFWHRRSIRRVQNFGDLGTFFVEFCILYVECPPYFYFRFVWPTDLESIPPTSPRPSIIPTMFEATKSTRSWVMSDNVSHWLPLKMRTHPLRMRKITWPVNRGAKRITYLESSTPIYLFTIQLPLGYDDD